MPARRWSRSSCTGRNWRCLRRSASTQVTGFSLFMLKAVLSGRGDEVIDLAKVNLFR